MASLRHRESHRRLLRSVRSGPSRATDAIVVPASRPTYHLATAADMAIRLGCTLIVLCSRNARSTEFAALAEEWPGLRWAAMDLPAGYHHSSLEFATAGIDDIRVGRLGDLSLKRNLALVLARLVGWRSMLLLDDDIDLVDEMGVRRGAAALERLTMVGLTVRDYPDNSVVCHANRLVGRPQSVFIGGSALLVNCERLDSFFPEIYNEDLLFLHDSVARRTVGSAGMARQMPYDPFADPARAGSEEFGDLLAEGLFALLHHSHSRNTALDVGFWQHFLFRRREFIQGISYRLQVCRHEKDRFSALGALREAECRRSAITATSCVAYLRTWRADQSAWAARINGLDCLSSVAAAVEWLGLRRNLLQSGLSVPRPF